jgi:tRNA threonylcarbamoyladenosine biosynthesis protein TsaE
VSREAEKLEGLSVLSRTPEDTESLGAVLAPLLRAGDTVLLSGDLGAGKTTLVRGLARALGVQGPVTSPTFVLVHSYPTNAGFELLHADVWRLEQLQEVIDLAIAELVEDGAAAVIEWGERATPALADDCLHIDIEFARLDSHSPEQPNHAGGGPAPAPPEAYGPQGARRLSLYASGPTWRGRLAQLEANVGSFDAMPAVSSPRARV